jgi:predicted HNH restriction endonuclease
MKRPVYWKMIKESVENLNNPTTVSEIKEYITSKWGDIKSTAIETDIIAMTVNHDSRIHYRGNKKPRLSNSNSSYDLLFRTEKGRRGLLIKYEIEKHGIWEIFEDGNGKLGVRLFQNDSTQFTINDSEVSNKFIEGSATEVILTKYERNQEARTACLEHYGYMCSVCEFDFEKRYGKIGVNFIHVHHLTKLATIKKAHEVDPVRDLRPVCPNCHAMLHRQEPPLTIDNLKSMMRRV